MQYLEKAKVILPIKNALIIKQDVEKVSDVFLRYKQKFYIKNYTEIYFI